MAKEGDRGWTIDGFQAPDRGQKSEAIGKRYAAKAAEFLGLSDGGVVRREKFARGDKNLRYTNMPAVILEPCFISHP